MQCCVQAFISLKMLGVMARLTDCTQRSMLCAVGDLTTCPLGTEPNLII